MTIREASAEWQGALKEGSGRLRLGSGVFEGAYSFPSRFENGPGTNPEELIAAAHAGCFSMALSAILGREGHIPRNIRTTAKVHLGATAAGPTITRIELETQAEVADSGQRSSSGLRSPPRRLAWSRARLPAWPTSPSRPRSSTLQKTMRAGE